MKRKMIKAVTFVFNASNVKVNERNFLLSATEPSVKNLRVIERTGWRLEHGYDH